MYVSCQLEHKNRLDIGRSLPHIECIFVEICQLGKQFFLFVSIYRPPGSDVNMFNSDWFAILNIIDREKS